MTIGRKHLCVATSTSTPSRAKWLAIVSTGSTSPGARAIVVLPEGTCAPAEVARVSGFLADERAGQCGPCVHGLFAIGGATAGLMRSESFDEELRIRRWLEQVEGRGGCRHPDGAARFVGSALAVFADEVALHARGGRCSGRDLWQLPVQRRRERTAA